MRNAEACVNTPGVADPDWRTNMVERTCAVEGCKRPYHGRGWCRRHGRMQRLYGVTEVQRPTPEERFWSGVDRRGPDECWPWLRYKCPKGYGWISWEGRNTCAARVACILVNGPMPKGYETDHLCRNPPCCNPRHLEAVPRRINILRGISPAARHAAKTRCMRGHPFDRLTPAGGRLCRECLRAGRRAWVARGPAPGATHGVRATYQQGCRCDDCMRASRDYHRALRAAKASA